MKLLTHRIFIVLTIATLAGIAGLTAGCGGGGKSVGAVPGVGSGRGGVAAVVTLPRTSGRSAAQYSTGTLLVDISISGYYGPDSEEFDPVTEHVEIDLSAGPARVEVLEVPIGVNHMLAADITYPDGATRTIRGIIPEVAEDTTTQVTVNERSTVIADAALALADSEDITLPDITPEQIEALAAAVDAMYNGGIPYAEISVDAVLSYGTNGTVPALVEVAPATASLNIDQTQLFSAVVKNAFGVTLTDSVTWSVSGGIGAVGTDGTFTASAAGTGLVTATAGSASGSALITVIPPAPSIASAPYVSAPAFGDSFSGSFTASNGQPPLSWSISSGELPTGWTLDPATGLLTGVLPDYVSAWWASIRVTDALGRATDSTSDASFSFTLSVADALNEFKQKLSIADSALNSISDLLNQMMQMAMIVMSEGDPVSSDSQYQAMLAEIDNIVQSATYNGTPLIDGTYAVTPLSVAVSGGTDPVTISPTLADCSSAGLGLTGSNVADMSNAGNAYTLVNNAIAVITENRSRAGVSSATTDRVLNINAIAVQTYAVGSCLPDLYTTASSSDLVLGEVASTLERMSAVVTQGQLTTRMAGGVVVYNPYQAEYDSINDFLTGTSRAATFRGQMLVDGTLNATCSGAPTVTNPDVSATGLGLYGLNAMDTATLTQIDTAIALIAAQRSTLAAQMAAIQALIP